MSEEPLMVYADTDVSDGQWSVRCTPISEDRPVYDFDVSVHTGGATFATPMTPRRMRALIWLLQRALVAAGEPTNIEADPNRYGPG